MAAPQPRSGGDTLRLAADRLYALAERFDTVTRSLSDRQRLHDDIETVAADVRATVRGPIPAVCPPLWSETRPDGSWQAGW